MTVPPAFVLDHLRRVAARPELPERYRLDSLIGKGGMGEVWAAHDRVLDRDVAVKVIADELAAPELTRRLEREALILARLEHPGIVPVHDAGTLPDGRAFYVMRLVRGERLDEHAARDHPLGELLRLFARVVEPVAYAHAHGIMHRDLKPSNVMIGPFGEVLVIDWGVAHVAGDPGVAHGTRPAAAGHSSDTLRDDPVTHPGSVLGTPGFMAPEQAAGGPVDARTDVYGLGAILGSLLLGRTDVPRPLAAIVARARAEAPAERYQSASALGADIVAFLDRLPVSAYREGLLERLARFGARHRVAILLFSAYIIMRALILVFRGI